MRGWCEIERERGESGEGGVRVEREGGVRVGNNRKKREWGVRWMSRKGERENVEWEGGVTVEE